MESSKENKMQNVNEQEMEKVTGGDLIDDAICLFKGHEWKEVMTVGWSDGIYYRQYVCTRCGKHRYVRGNRNSGQTVEIDEQEFNRALHS